MHFTNAAAAVSLLAISAHAWNPSSTNGTDRLAAVGKVKLEKYHPALGHNSSCSSDNTAVRKEWLSLSDEEKIAYTDAVKCLMELPSIGGDAIPGAKSRFDDFVGVHINQTPFIHVTVSHAFIHLQSSQELTQNRATSSHGTATSPGPTSTPSAQSAATKATNPTSTGASTPTTSSARHSSTAARLR
jgi:hypothetical protein